MILSDRDIQIITIAASFACKVLGTPQDEGNHVVSEAPRQMWYMEDEEFNRCKPKQKDIDTLRAGIAQARKELQ